jgi:hypothetical protein
MLESLDWLPGEGIVGHILDLNDLTSLKVLRLELLSLIGSRKLLDLLPSSEILPPNLDTLHLS